jgi:nitrogen-specific signal transduction histidine kinase
MYKYWLFLILILFNTRAWAQYQLKGTVKEETGKVVSDVRIAIAGKEIYSVTDSKGNFTYLLDDAPQMPIKVNAVKLGYELKEVNFSEDDKFLEVIIKKLPNPDQGKVEFLQLVSDSTIAYKWLTLLVDGYTYNGEESGKIYLKQWATYNSDILIPGFQIQKKEYNKKDKSLKIVIIPFRLDDEVMLSLTDSVDYKKNFEGLFRQFELEKRLITESNLKIEREMNKIIRQLEGDSAVSDEHRTQLLSYLSHLEELYESNKNTLENVIEKKYNLLFKMKAIILQKDSINMLSKKELAEYKLKQEQIEAEYRIKMIYSSVIIGLVLVILMVVFINNRKIKRQSLIIEEQNRNLDAFVSKASHEIKGPLNSLKGLSDVALKTVKDKESLEYFEYINKTVQKLTKTLNNMLYFSRAKNIVPEYSEIKLQSFVDEAIKGLMFKESFDKIKISNRISEKYVISSDEVILNSVIQNLIGNAIKYHDSKKASSYLDIDAEEKNNIITMQFKDNGIGIDNVHKNKLFGMFYRATNEAEGTGLGLYIVKLSIEKLGGTIEFESEPGEFTKFTVTIPVRKIN